MRQEEAERWHLLQHFGFRIERSMQFDTGYRTAAWQQTCSGSLVLKFTAGAGGGIRTTFASQPRKQLLWWSFLWSKEGTINFQYCRNLPVTQLTLFWFQELEPSNMIAVLEPQDNFNCEQASFHKGRRWLLPCSEVRTSHPLLATPARPNPFNVLLHGRCRSHQCSKSPIQAPSISGFVQWHSGKREEYHRLTSSSSLKFKSSNVDASMSRQQLQVNWF